MNKRRIIDLIQHPEKIELNDVRELEELVIEFPYFQNAYFLIARGNKEHKSLNTSASVQRAAVFAPDRGQLKRFLEGFPKKDVPKQEILTEVVSSETDALSDVNKSSEQEAVFNLNVNPANLISFDNVAEEKMDSDSLIFELQDNLKKLHDYREGLENAEREFKNLQPKKESKPKPLKAKVEAKSNFVPKKETLQSVGNVNPEKKNKQGSSKPTQSIQSKPEQEKKSKVKNLPKEEQIKLIEEFIVASPHIPKVSYGTIPDGENNDLSAHTKYDIEDFITENLAVIMEKQGKTDKALEIYNKLIWKFPQKKAYFATQIERLKK